jgi:hypothetical protein
MGSLDMSSTTEGKAKDNYNHENPTKPVTTKLGASTPLKAHLVFKKVLRRTNIVYGLFYIMLIWQWYF